MLGSEVREGERWRRGREGAQMPASKVRAENKGRVLVGPVTPETHLCNTHFYHGNIICLDFEMEKVLQGRNDKTSKWIP